MSLAPSYGCFGCQAFADNLRTQRYIQWACATGRIKGDPAGLLMFARGLCTCPEDDDEWTNPIDDQVCWYDPLIPESADFLGIVIEGIGGLRSSTFKRELATAIGRGSILGQPTIEGKQMVLEVLIVATSIAGQNYGIQWLERQFEDDQRCPADGASCASCQGQLLTLRLHCPDEDDLDRGLHSWGAAGTIDGFTPDDNRFVLGRRNCEKILAGTLTIATEQSDSYSTEPISTTTVDISSSFQALGNCLLGDTGLTLDDVCCPICSVGCDPCTTDPGCDCIPPFLLEPEILTDVAPCLTEPVCRCISSAQITNLPAGYDTALRLTFHAGSNPEETPQGIAFQRFGMRNAVFRVFERPEIEEVENGIVMPTNLEQYEALVERITPCVEVGVSWVPAGAELVVDGLSGRSWLKCQGRCVDHSNRVEVISGEIFPLKARCTDLIITVEWDCLNAQGVEGDTTILSSFDVEAFLGFKL